MPDASKTCGRCRYGTAELPSSSDGEERLPPLVGDLYCVVGPPQPMTFEYIGLHPNQAAAFPSDPVVQWQRSKSYKHMLTTVAWGHPQVSKDASCGRFSER